MKILLIVQARINSKRLPGKVLKKINNKTIIEILLNNLKKVKEIDQIIVAISNSKSDDILNEHLKKIGFNVFRGSEEDVLDRFYQTAKINNAKNIIRITADCPLIDVNVLASMINIFFENKPDYLCNTMPPTWPDGLDVEIFTFKALETAWKLATTNHDREHVTPFIRHSKNFILENYFNDIDSSNERWTLDEQNDLEVIQNILNNITPSNLTYQNIMSLKNSKPELFQSNKSIKRNEGAEMSEGQKLWKRAKQIIPGGNMLLSKRSELWLPEYWPSYYMKSKGYNVWTLDNIKLVDMIFAVGQSILGYANQEIEKHVIDTVKSGNMSTLNCPEEVKLAEKLIDLHPWAEMVRFARSGGEANAIAIRIARAASGNNKVAICGYHGWHDWYLAANLNNDNELESHLLPGLNPLGVPKSLEGTIFPFDYNDFKNLEKLVSKEGIGIIKMEVSRNYGPKDNFLQKVRKLCDEKNIILIFDECTSGFRQTNGGLHKVFGVNPDMAMFGKAMGNGHAITAVIGKRSIMDAAQSTFISSTFWTERIGPAAALKTIEIMEKIKSWEIISNTGRGVKKKWKEIADLHSIPIEISGIDPLCSYSIGYDNSLAYKTYVTQEMLKKGFLAGNLMYVSIVHDQFILDQYFSEIEKIFKKISKIEKEGNNILDYLDGPVCHDTFKRLN